ncbi:MAG: recombination mediator RecR [Candidatus Omnitrophica bacterium]|nr:recombination mediator RecR [Candidatus Omnitrophota bacterium]MBU4488792.1 recombination mediator RecR [Candidatus Omnitrophota bacterium]MCG2705449.1 recombination mediator RecR [Candidatus Omnitrophota bacterium]
MNRLSYARSIQSLIKEFSKMPGIGTKTAERLAFYILKLSMEDAQRLADSILKVKSTIRFCKACNNLSEGEICLICQDGGRDKGIICVVEEPNDVSAIEKAGKFNGVYHVLLGRLSPLDGVGPESLKINELVERVKKDKVKEVIVATNSDTEGETTALYIAKTLKPYRVKITRLAHGIPVGSDLKYADQATLMKAIEGRLEI